MPQIELVLKRKKMLPVTKTELELHRNSMLQLWKKTYPKI